ncbi:MAG: YciI family protein [Alphaproteobacteria bacterium]|nr:YciI family protein [Alphaproteobacteria bacterium]
MFAIALIRYRSSIEDVLKVVEDHRAYLKQLQHQGYLIASGPFSPRYGGALLLHVPDENTKLLDNIRDQDPFIKANIAQYEILIWHPTIGLKKLQSLLINND